MPTLFVFLLHWFQSQTPLAQIGIVVAITQAIATFIVGLLPQRWGDNPLVKALGHYGYAKFNDAFGTWKWPFLSARDPQPDAKPTPRIPPLPLLLLLVFAIACSSGCYHADGRAFTAVEVGHAAVDIAHDAAKLLCAARPLEAALAISAGLTMEPAVADLFCGTVAVVEASIARDAMRVLPDGVEPMRAPTYSVAANTFAVRAAR